VKLKSEHHKFTIVRDNMAAAFVCGFCHRGQEVVEVCGKLWHDANKNCTAHQRCMVTVTARIIADIMFDMR